jgi:hypothetical protein
LCYGLSATQAAGAITIISDNDDGAFSATETITDNAGNKATGSVTLSGFTNIDNQAPVFSSVSSDRTVYTSGDDIDLTVDMTEASTEISSVKANMSILDSSMSSTFGLSAGSPTTQWKETTPALDKNTMNNDGTYNITITATDNAGNIAEDVSLEVQIYKNRPSVYGVVVTPNPTKDGETTIVTGSIVDDIAVIGAKYSIENWESTAIVTDQTITTPKDGSWGNATETVEINISSDINGLADGIYAISIYGKDANGFGSYERTTFTINTNSPTPSELESRIDLLNQTLINSNSRIDSVNASVCVICNCCIN